MYIFYYFRIEIMTKKVCEKLLKGPEENIESETITKRPGIYGIFEKDKNNGKLRLLYVGKSNKPNRRIKEHLRGDDQAIDRKIKRTAKKRLFVQEVPVDDPGRNEKKFIDCMKDEMGKKLPYNKTGGNSKSKKTKARRRKTKNK